MSSPEPNESKSAESGYALSLFELLLGKKTTEDTEPSNASGEPESATRWRIPTDRAPIGGNEPSALGTGELHGKRAVG